MSLANGFVVVSMMVDRIMGCFMLYNCDFKNTIWVNKITWYTTRVSVPLNLLSFRNNSQFDLPLQIIEMAITGRKCFRVRAKVMDPMGLCTLIYSPYPNKLRNLIRLFETFEGSEVVWL